MAHLATSLIQLFGHDLLKFKRWTCWIPIYIFRLYWIGSITWQIFQFDWFEYLNICNGNPLWSRKIFDFIPHGNLRTISFVLLLSFSNISKRLKKIRENFRQADGNAIVSDSFIYVYNFDINWNDTSKSSLLRVKLRWGLFHGLLPLHGKGFEWDWVCG